MMRRSFFALGLLPLLATACAPRVTEAEAVAEAVEHLHRAIVERDGTKVAFLACSAILFPGYEARPGKPGCTPISVITDYAMSEIEQPGCEAIVTTVVHPSSLQMLRTDIVPNILGSIIVVATFEIAHAILLEASLSFLGLGVKPPFPSWGLMIAEAKDYMFFKPW